MERKLLGGREILNWSIGTSEFCWQKGNGDGKWADFIGGGVQLVLETGQETEHGPFCSLQRFSVCVNIVSSMCVYMSVYS